MKRAAQLGAVEFGLNTLFIQEEMTNDSVIGTVKMSAAGTHITHEATIYSPYITLDSKQYGWVKEAQMTTLVAMWEQLETTFTLTYDDATTDTVRMAKEKNMVFTPLSEGCDHYTATIPLAIVI